MNRITITSTSRKAIGAIGRHYVSATCGVRGARCEVRRHSAPGRPPGERAGLAAPWAEPSLENGESDGRDARLGGPCERFGRDGDIHATRAGVAQLVEQLIRNQQVRGSSPRAGSKNPSKTLTSRLSQGVAPCTPDLMEAGSMRRI